jgi:ribose-phosphate pyrophosphokinase
MKNIRIFAMDGFEEFARRVARDLGISLTPRQEKTFADGEPYIKSATGKEGNVRAADCYIICSLFSDKNQSVNDKFIKVLFFAGSLKDASAARITLVAPYLSYQRQDRKTESRAGIYTSYTAKLLKSMKIDRLITMDVHNLAATQSALSMSVLFDNLEAKNRLCDFICGGIDKHGMTIDNHLPNPLCEYGNCEVVVLAPDSGGVGRAKRFRNELEKRLDLENKIPVLHLDKERNASGELKTKQGEINGDVRDKKVIIYDDIIASGSTIQLCCNAVKNYGGEVWAVCATHGILSEKSVSNLIDIDKIILTDTIQIPRNIKEELKNKLFICNTTQLFAEAIKRTHYEGGSITELLD